MVRLLALILVSLALPVYPVPTGLNTIPIAKVLSPGILDLNADVEKNGPTTTHTIGFEFGIKGGIEFGYDVEREPGERKATWNAKLITARRKDNMPVLAVGVLDIKSGLKAEPYVVGRIPIYKSWLHGGVIKAEEAARLLIGFSADLNKEMELLLDYQGGKDGELGIGISCDLRRDMEIHLAYLNANSGPDRSGYIIELDWHPRLESSRHGSISDPNKKEQKYLPSLMANFNKNMEYE